MPISHIEQSALRSDIFHYKRLRDSNLLNRFTNWASGGEVNRNKIADRLYDQAGHWASSRADYNPSEPADNHTLAHLILSNKTSRLIGKLNSELASLGPPNHNAPTAELHGTLMMCGEGALYALPQFVIQLLSVRDTPWKAFCDVLSARINNDSLSHELLDILKYHSREILSTPPKEGESNFTRKKQLVANKLVDLLITDLNTTAELTFEKGPMKHVLEALRSRKITAVNVAEETERKNQAFKESLRAAGYKDFETIPKHSAFQ